MRPFVIMLGLAVGVTAGITARPDSVQATILYPWCAHYLSPNGAQNCGFVTWQQCLAAISGNGGTCEANPFYAPQPMPIVVRQRSPRPG